MRGDDTYNSRSLRICFMGSPLSSQFLTLRSPATPSINLAQRGVVPRVKLCSPFVISLSIQNDRPESKLLLKMFDQGLCNRYIRHNSLCISSCINTCTPLATPSSPFPLSVCAREHMYDSLRDVPPRNSPIPHTLHPLPVCTSVCACVCVCVCVWA